jgi:hypothetical protein
MVAIGEASQIHSHINASITFSFFGLNIASLMPEN